METFMKVVLFLFLNTVGSEKVWKSVPVTVKSYENETVLLPCYVNESENPVRVRWYRNEDLLGDTGTPHQLLPPRFRIYPNFSLELDGLRPQDTAHYTCEVIRPEPLGPVKQTHSVQVQYAPIIKTIPENGFLEIKKGQYVDIGCEVSGVPTPIVDWKKNGEPMALLEHRSRIKFKADHRLLAGIYECTADNGIGGAVTASIRVIIEDAPVAYPVSSYVHTAVGLRAVLAARLEFSVPPPTAAWYKDGRRVRTDGRVVEFVHNWVHQLIFRKVLESDFGNYTFRLENGLGMVDVSFRLTGIPKAASFKVDPALNKATPTSFTLIWEVDSYSTIIEYNLWLRPYYGRLSTTEPDGFTTEAPANLWSKIVVPGDSTEGPIHSATYTVRGLTPSTVYEAIVTSRNKYGWSKQSAILHFATEPGTGRRPSTADYSDITPLLEESEPEEAHNITQAQVFEQISRGGRGTPAAILMFIPIVLYFR